MSDPARNPYDSASPEWQLWENMTSSYLLAQAHAADAERKQSLCQQAREKGDRFKAALEKLKA